MSYFYILLAAIAPVLVLLLYIYRKDSAQPEPTSWLLRAFGYGIASVLVSLSATSLLQLLTGLSSDVTEQTSVLGAFASAFTWAAIPEESAKLLMLWLLLRKNPYFDDHMDGIVYAVCVGLGFACVENIMYVFDGLADGSWLSTGISRALFAVPGHFLFAVMMGYYYSLYHFRLRRNLFTKLLIWIAPVLAHGIYDGILFSMQVSTAFSAIGMIVFLLFFAYLRRLGKRRIDTLAQKAQSPDL